MDLTLVIGLVLIVFCAVIDAARRPKRPRAGHSFPRVDMGKARREGTLGSPRLASIGGRLFVLGYGRRFQVANRIDGQKLMDQLTAEVRRALESLGMQTSSLHQAAVGAVGSRS